MFGPSSYWTALNDILDVFLLQMLFDVLIAVFVSDNPFIFSSWVESGNDSTLQHRSEQTSIITSPRAPIGNKSEINHYAMQITIDQFFLVQTANCLLYMLADTSPSFYCYTRYDYYYYYMSMISFSATLSDCELSASPTIEQSVSSLHTPPQRLTLKERFVAWHRRNIRGLRRLFAGCVRPTAIQWHFEYHKGRIWFLYHMSDVYILVHCDVNNCYVMSR